MIALLLRHLTDDSFSAMISKATLLGFTIFIAGIIALVRFNKAFTPYLPFVLCIWLGCINELISYFLWQNGWHTSVNNNIYVLAEAILFLLFFRNMGLFEKQSLVFWGLFGALLVLWGWENIVEGKITAVSSWFRIAYSFLIVILSVATISLLLYQNIHTPWLTEERNIFLHPVFLICCGAIIFFTFKLVIEIFWLYGIDHSSNFRKNLYHILIYINPAVNLIYTLAILWMPRKQRYIIQ
ncbi:MAG: hypothetical protein ACTHM5_20985 [Ginsengibacter sp.]